MIKCLIILPTFNEFDNLVPLVTQILAQSECYEILVVDDNSPDGTGALAQELAAASFGRVHVLHRAGKLGLASAYLDGFRFGLEHNYDFIFEMDADFSHQPHYLPKLLAAAQRAGIAIGSRNIPGGDILNWPWHRKFISHGGSLYARGILGLKIKDCTSGFKCFSQRVLRELNLPELVQANGFGFQVEVNCLCEWRGYSIEEVPIVFPDRVSGKSKMNQKIFWEALFLVWKLQARRKQVGVFQSRKTLSEVEEVRAVQ